MRDAKGKFCKGRPFKVGDVVEGKSTIGRMVLGVIDQVEPPSYDGELSVRINSGRWLFTNSLRLITPAPETLPESSLTTASAEREAVLIRERDEARKELARIRIATGIHESDEPSLARAVQSIADQMDRHRQERDSARKEMTENYKNYRKADDRAEAAEAKLADIHSIMRVTALSTNAFDVNSLILKVLDRE